MKISIRTKLFIYMITIIMFFLAVLIFSNTFFAEKYYLKKMKKQLKTSSTTIETLVNDTNLHQNAILTDETVLNLLNFEKENGQTLYIASSDGEFLFPTAQMLSIHRPPSNTMTTSEPPQYKNRLVLSETEMANEKIYQIITVNGDIEGIDIEGIDVTDGAVVTPSDSISAIPGNPKVIQQRRDLIEIIDVESDNSFFLLQKNFGQKTLGYQTATEDNKLLLITIPMTIISDGTEILNGFIASIGAVTIIFTAIWSFFISFKFTEPITLINKIAGKMRNLDFSENIKLKGNDEIFELSQNINSLSDTLDKTIFELNEKNRALEKDIDRERKIDKMRRDFISNVSHELKTPIFLIQGYADGLKANITSEDKKEFYCDVISEEADTMDKLVQDLLSVAKLETDNNEIEKREFEINEYLRNIIKKYELLLQELDLKITIDFINDIYVYADSEKIEQVLRNFINNAIEHVDENKIIQIKLIKLDGKIKIAVYNSGKNIDDIHGNKIWDSFYKTDKARTHSIGGAGLGLSIVKAILKNHKCNFGMDNLASGVEFWWELDITQIHD